MRSSPAASVSSFVLLLLPMVLATGPACDAPPEAAVETAGALPVRRPHDAGTDVIAESPPAIDVGGVVVDDREEPVVGRPVDLVDARGKHVSRMTDEGGAFWVSDVVRPYDVVVAPAASGAIITPLVYLGLTRDHPRFEVFERGGPVSRPASQPLRVGVVLPPCRAAEGACWVTVTSASASGRGGTAASYVEGAVSAVYDFEHGYDYDSVPPAAETIDVHVLAGDARNTWYAYAAVTGVAASPGEPRDLGMVTPRGIEASAPVTITGRAPGLPEGWQWTLATELDLPGGASIPLRYDWATSSVLRLPRLDGASLRVNAWAQEPNEPAGPVFHRSAQARSGVLPVPCPDVTLDLAPPPVPLRPAPGGEISAHAAGLTWQGDTRALASLVVVDAARGQQRLRAFTSEPQLAYDRLIALGLGRLEPGAHVVDLATTPGLDVDALTEPDETAREERSGIDQPGRSSYQRFGFTVTP
ncbi:MAG: hypothetical protein JWP97_3898 [Labilithrix sp.]|nr:hypothetical protein [Labilithrix sp.]